MQLILFIILCLVMTKAEEYKLPSARIPPGQRRPPGKLLLNMLTYNEAQHLERTLPKWKKIIDCWVIGLDEKNTDNSEEIILRELGHIPGQVVKGIHFEGFGPAWSILVDVGIKNFNMCTHGIIADADYAPMQDHLDKMELDIRCSKHMYTVWTEDHRNERKMDWIYRNIPGAVVKRRTHQVLEVPKLPDQEVFQTLINLHVDEREGGAGDRSGKKNERYIEFLEKDLLDYPNDTRTLYYLGYAHFDIFNQRKDKPSQADWDHLARGVQYFKQRANTPGGNEEELWFALLKLGEIYERFYNDWTTAEKYYLNCTKSDPARADAWFYIGQHYRLHQQPEKGLPHLHTAATLVMPERSLFQWHYLYECLSKLEYGRAVSALKDATADTYKEARRILAMADCDRGDPGNKGELVSLKEVFALKLLPQGKNEKSAVVKKLLKFINKNYDAFESSLNSLEVTGEWNSEADEPENLWHALFQTLLKLKEYKAAQSQQENESEGGCREYRRATTPYLKLYKSHRKQIEEALGNVRLADKLEQLSARVRAVCR